MRVSRAGVSVRHGRRGDRGEVPHEREGSQDRPRGRAPPAVVPAVDVHERFFFVGGTLCTLRPVGQMQYSTLLSLLWFVLVSQLGLAKLLSLIRDPGLSTFSNISCRGGIGR